jgi:WhiB family transcriptional regulator, redox-sensing transcriptional regulator
VNHDCGTIQRYRQGCRCAECKEANRVYVNEYRQRHRAAAERLLTAMAEYHEGDTSWLAKANCQGVDTEKFFPTRGEMRLIEEARQVCAACDVVDDCLSYALRTDQPVGIWGGKSAREREAMRASLRVVA